MSLNGMSKKPSCSKNGNMYPPAGCSQVTSPFRLFTMNAAKVAEFFAIELCSSTLACLFSSRPHNPWVQPSIADGVSNYDLWLVRKWNTGVPYEPQDGYPSMQATPEPS